ncbi:hypothetical protein J0695_11470 [Streptomyces beijiangensis]|uniref:Uncharacterized protein n=2 Tax=Streptomyces beijiangensis TaxID=163361 RepID=A0A939F5H5_9ACTN|nr:hypothetical protein [Streptomyces beijiangensis]
MAAAVVWRAPWHESRLEHANGAGPLQSHTDVGTTSMFAPQDKATWYGTFGSYLMCSTSGAKITVEGIRYSEPVKPAGVSAELRTVTAKQRQNPTRGGYVGGGIGRPPHLSTVNMLGNLAPAGAGTVIDQKCSDQDKQSNSFQELLFVLKTDQRGGRIDHVWIDYRLGSDAYSLRLDWQMITCGDRVPKIDGEDVCDGSAGS